MKRGNLIERNLSERGRRNLEGFGQGNERTQRPLPLLFCAHRIPCHCRFDVKRPRHAIAFGLDPTFQARFAAQIDAALSLCVDGVRDNHHAKLTSQNALCKPRCSIRMHLMAGLRRSNEGVLHDGYVISSPSEGGLFLWSRPSRVPYPRAPAGTRAAGEKRARRAVSLVSVRAGDMFAAEESSPIFSALLLRL